VIETEPFCFGLKAEGPIEAMGAISGMALVREKLDLVASGGSGVGKDSPHDGGGDAFAAMADGDDEGLDVPGQLFWTVPALNRFDLVH
jgi:hypothetical protein